MADQLVLIQNFQSKIGTIGPTLGLTTTEITAAGTLCVSFVDVFNVVEQAKSTMQAMTAWRNAVFYGEPIGGAAAPAPVFPVVGTDPYKNGIVKQFQDLRDRIVAAPGYTVQIGEDLGIVGPEATPKLADNVAPELKTSTSMGYWVNINGSMQGMGGLRVEYAPSGGQFKTVAFLTNMPGSIQITPAQTSQPELGQVRAVFIKKNEEFGNYSPNYPVVLA
jgi:hypothetical protein